MAPIDAVVASRIGASIAVGVTAWLLVPIARRLFVANGTRIGVIGGLAVILISPANGGWPSIPSCSTLRSRWQVSLRGCAALRIQATRARLGRPGRTAAGCGHQVKTTVIFDLLAFGPGFLLLTVPAIALLPAHLLANLRALVLLGVTIALPTLLVVLLYLATGQFDLWFHANVTAVSYVPADYVGRTFGASDLIMRIYEQAPIWIASGLALILARGLAVGPGEMRSVLFLALWLAAVMLGQVVLRMGYDHYFLQFLPALGLLTGFVIVGAWTPTSHRAGCDSSCWPRWPA